MVVLIPSHKLKMYKKYLRWGLAFNPDHILRTFSDDLECFQEGRFAPLLPQLISLPRAIYKISWLFPCYFQGYYQISYVEITCTLLSSLSTIYNTFSVTLSKKKPTYWFGSCCHSQNSNIKTISRLAGREAGRCDEPGRGSWGILRTLFSKTSSFLSCVDETPSHTEAAEVSVGRRIDL